jgi:hypothetical protein
MKSTWRERKTIRNIRDINMQFMKSGANTIDSEAKPIDSVTKPIDSEAKPIDSKAKPIDSVTKTIDSVTKTIGFTSNFDKLNSYHLMYKSNK